MVLALYLTAGGALGKYIAAMRYAAGYTGQGGPWMPPEGPTLRSYLQAVRFSFLYWASARLVLTTPAVTGGFFGVFVLRERRIQQLVLFVVLAYVGIAAQAKFFWYQYWYMLPFLALLGGWTWDRTFSLLHRSQPRVLALTASAALVGGLLLSTPEVLDNGTSQWRSYVHYYTRPDRREEFYAGFDTYLLSRNIADYVRSQTEPDEVIYVWGNDPLISLRADRRTTSRFFYSQPLMSAWAPSPWQRQFMDELQARPPAFFIVQRHHLERWITGHTIGYVDYIGRIPALQQWLENNYALDTESEAHLVYRRRD